MYSNPATVALAAFGLFTVASSHGLVLAVNGANGVSMPGLSVADGTPRDCSTPICGSEADTSIIRDNEIASGKAGPLGRTEGKGTVTAAAMVANFMGNGAAAAKREPAGLLGGLLGGGGDAGGGDEATGTKVNSPKELSVAQSAGKGATSGLPTCADDGTIALTYRQINQDGAGPLTADVDGTSGGTKADAFQSAEVTSNVPGAIAGLSLATNTNFPIKVQMPAGMTCDATVGSASNVCVVRVRNNTPAGPFGGSAVFTQTAAQRKRAIAYRMKKRAEEKRDAVARRSNTNKNL